MKTATFSSLLVDPELRQAAEESLKEGETISSIVEQSIRDNIARRQRQREFLGCGLASLGEAARSGAYVSSEVVLGRLEQMLAKVKAGK